MSVDQEEEKSAVEWPPDDEGDDAGHLGASVVRQAMAADPSLMLDAIIDALMSAREAAKAPPPPYHTVVVPDIGVDAVLTTVDTFDEFLAVWRRAWEDHAAQIFGFHKGEVILPSKGGDCMVASWGSFPLFVRAADTEADAQGRLGKVAPILKAAPPAAEVAADEEEPEVEEDEEFDENSPG